MERQKVKSLSNYNYKYLFPILKRWKCTCTDECAKGYNPKCSCTNPECHCTENL